MHFDSRRYEPSSIPQLREQFKKYEGGCVTLRKDENSGIAYITLDHAEKKNGMSGWCKYTKNGSNILCFCPRIC